jgi:hypothetical protein
MEHLMNMEIVVSVIHVIAKEYVVKENLNGSRGIEN